MWGQKLDHHVKLKKTLWILWRPHLFPILLKLVRTLFPIKSLLSLKFSHERLITMSNYRNSLRWNYRIYLVPYFHETWSENCSNDISNLFGIGSLRGQKLGHQVLIRKSLWTLKRPYLSSWNLVWTLWQWNLGTWDQQLGQIKKKLVKHKRVKFYCVIFMKRVWYPRQIWN